MLDRLKKAILGQRHGEAEAELILRVEGLLERMPSALATKPWCDWLWRLPPEAWLEAIDLRTIGATIVERRERAVRAITRLNRVSMKAAGSMEVEEARREVETMKEDLRGYEASYRDRRRAFASRWGEPPPWEAGSI